MFLFQARWLRRFYLVVVFYLIALLLLWIVPNTFLDQGLPHEIQLLAQYGLPVLFLVMAVIPAEPDSAETPQIVDFFYATLIFLLLLVLVLGTFAFMRVGQRALCAGAHLQPARPGRRPAAAVAGLESARRISRPVDVFLALPAVDRAAVRAMAVFPRRTVATGNPARAVPEGGLRRARAAAVGDRVVSGTPPTSRGISAPSPGTRSSTPTRRCTCACSRAPRSRRR